MPEVDAVPADSPRFDAGAAAYDAVLLLSFGGPEGPDDVRPFLENVLRGRPVPRERFEAVAGHYLHFGGVSPINAQNRALIAALESELAAHGPRLPVYFGNRNWHPFVTDTIRRMRDDGVRRALAFVTSAFSSWSGCRQYREDLARAREAVGAGAPVFDKLRTFSNHPGFVAACADRLIEARGRLPADVRGDAEVLFTAHSIPLAMARHSAYEAQLAEAARLVAEASATRSWRLAYQSRSGAPGTPWLEPDVLEVIEERARAGARAVIVQPIGFVSDHMEVVYDLDVEAAERAASLGLPFVRAGTAGTHPEFVRTIRALIAERVLGAARESLGARGPGHDVCPPNCCLRA